MFLLVNLDVVIKSALVLPKLPLWIVLEVNLGTILWPNSLPPNLILKPTNAVGLNFLML